MAEKYEEAVFQQKPCMGQYNKFFFNSFIPYYSETGADHYWVIEALKFWLHGFQYHSSLDVKETQICGWVGILEGLRAGLLHGCQNSLFQQAWDHN